MTEVAAPVMRLAELETPEAVTQEIAIAAQIFNERARLIAEREEELTNVRERYEEMIRPRTTAYDECEARCMAWASRNRKTHFATCKTFETEHGSIVLRKGQPKLAMKGKAKVADIVVKLKAAKLFDFIRKKETLDKEALLKKRDSVITTEDGQYNLDDLGLRVSQPERFKLIIVQEPPPAAEVKRLVTA